MDRLKASGGVRCRFANMNARRGEVIAQMVGAAPKAHIAAIISRHLKDV